MWQHCSLSAVQRQTVVICFSLWLRKQRQRFAQGQPKGYFETKVFKLLLNHAKSIIPMKERWGRLRMLRYDEFDKATNFTQTPKENKNEFWNCDLAMLGRVAKPIFTSLSPGQPFRI